MADSLMPVASIGPDRRAGRRATDPALAREEPEPAPTTGSNLPVVVAPLRPEEPPAAAFEAQILGQQGQKRGLRGGPAVLNSARSAYLGAEWSGHADRRPPKGVISKTEV